MPSGILARADKIYDISESNVIEVFERSDLEKCDSNIVNDVDSYFDTSSFKDDYNSLSIVKYIDKAKALNKNYYIDRFGMKLQISDLSTGSKAALLVYSNPDIVINMAEAGINALEAVLLYVKRGKILLSDYSLLSKLNHASNIKIKLYGRKEYNSYEEYNEDYE